MYLDSPLPERALPYWAQITSFAFAAIGFIGTAFVSLSEYLRSAELDVKVTKDCFYRLIERGEAVFCRATLLARNGPVLIRSVSVSLNKVDGAKKNFPLDVDQFGTLIPKAEKMFQEHNFFGRSTLHYLAADKPERIVYLCLHKQEYKSNQMGLIKAFNDDLTILKANQSERWPIQGELSESQSRLIHELVERHVPILIGALEVESGRYTLSISLYYESTSARFRRWRSQKHSEDSLTFTIPNDFAANMRAELKTTLTMVAINNLCNRAAIVKWPEFTPVAFVES